MNSSSVIMFIRTCSISLVLMLCAASVSAQDLVADIAALRQDTKAETAAIRQQQTRLQTKLQSETQDRRRLQGDIEELNFRLKRLESRFDNLVGALDLRLQDIEDAIAASKIPENPEISETPETPESSEEASTETAIAPSSTSTAPSTGTLGTITVDTEGAVTNVSLAEKTFEDRYDEALALMSKKAYPEARAKLQALVTEDSKHALSSNVLYWLGESYYVEGDYKSAMSQFARSAKQYPDGAKRLDSLLKIGLSLGNIGRIEQACKILHDMVKNVENIPSDIALSRDTVRKRFGCSG